MNISIFTKHNVLFITILTFLVFSFACNSSSGINATAVASVTVTDTASPTDTPAPTATVQPTATPTPSPTPTPLVTGLGQVIFSESFDDMDFPFHICGAAHIESGVLVVERGPEDPSPCGMFSGGIYGVDPIPPDTTVLVLFKTTSDFNIGIHTGDYGDETLRRFAFGTTQGIATWDMGKGRDLETWHTHPTRADSWYYFSIQRSANGDVTARLWQRDTPENVTEFHENLGSELGTLPFTFVSDFKDVPFFVDEYQILK